MKKLILCLFVIGFTTYNVSAATGSNYDGNPSRPNSQKGAKSIKPSATAKAFNAGPKYAYKHKKTKASKWGFKKGKKRFNLNLVAPVGQ